MTGAGRWRLAAALAVVVVVEENHAFEQVIGSLAAPFLNHLAARGALLTDYHAVIHPSLPNYPALLSGRTGRIHSDCRTCTMTGPTLVGELAAGPVWGQDTRLVVTFEESRGRDVRSCCDGLGRGGRIAAIAALALPTQAAT